MRHETPAAMRVRILKEFSQLKLPAMLPAQNDATPAELAMVRAIFRDGLVEGAILPDQTGSGITAIHITGISAEAHELIAATKPLARTKRVARRAWAVFVAVVAAIGIIFGILVSWRKLHEPQVTSPASPAASQSSPTATATQQP
jgi:hypothetical protein